MAELPLFDRRDLGRDWAPAPMVNNRERLDPWAPDPASDPIRAARERRRLTGLDEGRAWRRRDGGGLAVVRTELYADPDDREHRDAWRAGAESALDATWRARWRERDQAPGWIEARWVREADRPGPLRALGPGASGWAGAVDWLRIEDHTDPTGQGRVTVYEHLTLWHGRAQVTLTLRHPLGLDLDPVAAAIAVTALDRLTGAGA